MPQLKLSQIQDKSVRFDVRQGVEFPIEVAWLDLDEDGAEVPTDISDRTFISQIRTDYFEENGRVVVDFDTVPDANGNVYVIDVDEATVTHTVSAATSQSLTPEVEYFFECKMLDAGGDAVESFQAVIVAHADVARAV